MTQSISSADQLYMNRCLQLAENGLGYTYPNPMVGSVIVYSGKIIGEGYHRKCGEAHAEVNAINSVQNKSLLKYSTIYVNLEPCSHFGKTPPCAEFIIKHQIQKVVISTTDTNPLVAGKGIEKLMKAGCEVITNVLTKESRELNKRFFTFQEKKRPYIILKWAQTLDGFIDIERGINSPCQPTWITNDYCRMLVHKWRSEESAIMVGTNTIKKDNPQLNIRDWVGINPIRIVIDKDLSLNLENRIFDHSAKTIIFYSDIYPTPNKLFKNQDIIPISFKSNILPQIMNILYTKNIQSVIIEGGKILLQSLIDIELWDEARIFVGNKYFSKGVEAPKIKNLKKSDIFYNENYQINYIKNV